MSKYDDELREKELERWFNETAQAAGGSDKVAKFVDKSGSETQKKTYLAIQGTRKRKAPKKSDDEYFTKKFTREMDDELQAERDVDYWQQETPKPKRYRQQEDKLLSRAKNATAMSDKEYREEEKRRNGEGKYGEWERQTAAATSEYERQDADFRQTALKKGITGDDNLFKFFDEQGSNAQKVSYLKNMGGNTLFPQINEVQKSQVTKITDQLLQKMDDANREAAEKFSMDYAGQEDYNRAAAVYQDYIMGVVGDARAKTGKFAAGVYGFLDATGIDSVVNAGEKLMNHDLGGGRFEASKTNQGESYAKGEAFGYFVNTLTAGAVIGKLPFVKNTASTLGNTISRLSGGKISAAEATTMALDKGKDITLDIADVVKTGAEQGQSLQEMAEELFVRQMQTLGMESLFSGATRVTISETLDGNLGILKKFAGDEGADAAKKVVKNASAEDLARAAQKGYTSDADIATYVERCKTLRENNDGGMRFAAAGFAEDSKEVFHAQREITVVTKQGTKFRPDGLTKVSEFGTEHGVFEYKNSPKATYTNEQIKGYKELADAGGNVAGKGKGIFTNGYEIPPTKHTEKRNRKG